jgi:hypothetical protein
VPSRRGDRAPPPPLPPRANTGRRRADARLEWSAGPERGNLGSHEWGNKAHNASSLALVRCFTIEGRRQQSLAQSQLRFSVLN